MAEVWLGAGGQRVGHGEEELGDMGQEHQPQNVIVLYIARGEGSRTLSIKKTWERKCERHKDAKHVHLQNRGVYCVHLKDS